MDKIFIRDLHLRTVIGIHDWERETKQDLHINLEIETDLQKPGQTDDIQDTLNYRTLTKQIIKLTEESSYYLIEKLAEQIAKVALNNDQAKSVKVTIDKPGALRFSRSVAVEVNRSKSTTK